jgi:hypothetical protein
MSKKFTFADLQPHVDMLCDALENKGASPSGVPYNDAVYPYAKMYRELLADIRNLKISHESLLNVLDSYKQSILEAAGDNQVYRVTQLVEAVNVFMIKEFDKVNSNEQQT